MPDTPLKVKPGGEYRCDCVLEHRPKPTELHRHHVWPLGDDGPNTSENLRWLCPTMHANVHELWRLMKKYNGQVPASTKRQFSHYCQKLVLSGWIQYVASKSS